MDKAQRIARILRVFEVYDAGLITWPEVLDSLAKIETEYHGFDVAGGTTVTWDPSAAVQRILNYC